jgi:hypothetical protein
MILFLKNKSGLLMIEIMISISLFALIAVLTGRILADIAKIEKRSTIENAIYDDVRMITQQLTYEIQNGAIDYEEYYNYYVLQDGETVPNVYYGINYGVYGSRFYEPGLSLDGLATFNPEDLGVECSYPSDYPTISPDCEVVYSLSTDLNTGQHPYSGDSNGKTTAFSETYPSPSGSTYGQDSTPNSYALTDNLFLIDRTGTKKTILAPKKTGDETYGIGLVRMEGLDIDQNGFVDAWKCLEEFDCSGNGAGADVALASAISLPANIPVPEKSDLEVTFDLISPQTFIPITPLRSNIVSLGFIINPSEDPYKAYAENGKKSHPSVTIILTIGLAQEYEDEYPGDFEPITVQTTVTAGVVSKIETYPPITEVKAGGDNAWIKDALPW